MSQVALQTKCLRARPYGSSEVPNARKAEILMGSHIMSALEDIISSHIASKPEPATEERVGLLVPGNIT